MAGPVDPVFPTRPGDHTARTPDQYRDPHPDDHRKEDLAALTSGPDAPSTAVNHNDR
jgi:hypothetical protein